jgi:hypothetical protein
MMSYTKRNDIPCADGELVLQLDTGDLVAAQCPSSRDSMSNQVVFLPSARWIDDAGKARVDTQGRAVAVSYPQTMMPDEVTRIGATAVVKECLLLVLGEPLTVNPEHPEITLIPWSADTVAQCSVRNAIAAASVAAPSASEVL